MTSCKREGVFFYRTIDDIGREDWDALVGPDQPFLSFAFLHALEVSGCVALDRGWEPFHFAYYSAEGELLAAAPQYIKHHSYGEYVFDWAWADAYQRHGLNYYPKLLTAIPFTPCTGPRLLVSSSATNSAAAPDIASVYRDACVSSCHERSLSSWHILFPPPENSKSDTQKGLHRRNGVQYHWFNRGYQDFDAFLDALVSRKRKNIRKERQAIARQALTFRWVEGPDFTEPELERFYLLYRATYLKRGQEGYLNKAFFQELLLTMPSAMCFLLVESSVEIVAGALFFKGDKTLYGRYWGCIESYHALHFETCYYRGVEYCIEHGFAKFDAGAQGEHKLLRGFEPMPTCSYHWIENPDFERAIVDFLEDESAHVAEYILEAREGLPYKVTADTPLRK
jgi:predicted N-acyltransferase